MLLPIVIEGSYRSASVESAPATSSLLNSTYRAAAWTSRLAFPSVAQSVAYSTQHTCSYAL
jgi:hypothetical protein